MILLIGSALLIRTSLALRAVGRELMRNHLKHCATQAIRHGGDEARIEEAWELISALLFLAVWLAFALGAALLHLLAPGLRDRAARHSDRACAGSVGPSLSMTPSRRLTTPRLDGPTRRVPSWSGCTPGQ